MNLQPGDIILRPMAHGLLVLAPEGIPLEHIEALGAMSEALTKKGRGKHDPLLIAGDIAGACGSFMALGRRDELAAWRAELGIVDAAGGGS